MDIANCLEVVIAEPIESVGGVIQPTMMVLDLVLGPRLDAADSIGDAVNVVLALIDRDPVARSVADRSGPTSMVHRRDDLATGWLDVNPAPQPDLSSWELDPYQVHEHRYWDGRGWTEHVSDQGRSSTDSVPMFSPSVLPGQPEAAVDAYCRIPTIDQGWDVDRPRADSDVASASSAVRIATPGADDSGRADHVRPAMSP